MSQNLTIILQFAPTSTHPERNDGTRYWSVTHDGATVHDLCFDECIGHVNQMIISAHAGNDPRAGTRLPFRAIDDIRDQAMAAAERQHRLKIQDDRRPEQWTNDERAQAASTHSGMAEECNTIKAEQEADDELEAAAAEEGFGLVFDESDLEFKTDALGRAPERMPEPGELAHAIFNMAHPFKELGDRRKAEAAQAEARAQSEELDRKLYLIVAKGVSMLGNLLTDSEREAALTYLATRVPPAERL